MQAIALVLLALLYLGLVLLPFRAFLPRLHTHVIGDHADAILQHLHCSWQWLALAEGRFGEILRLPTMAPYDSGLAFGEPLVGIALPFAPVYLLSGSSTTAFNLAVVGSFVLLGLATFLFVREVAGSAAAGLLAAMLVLFPPWRIHYLNAVNVLTLHYAVLGMWLVARWLRRPGLGVLVVAALLFQLQLVTSVQNGVPAIYLVLVWLAVEWGGRRFRFEARRCLHLICAGGLFVALSLPWLAFFGEAFEARQGQPPTHQMAIYSETFAEMARLLGATGLLGLCAALGLLALPFGTRARLLPRGCGLTLLGVGLGAALLFVIGRGPFLGRPETAVRLPGYYLGQLLPLVGMFRAPIRLAGLTPIVLALAAGVGMSCLDAWIRQRWAPRAAALLTIAPLACALTWPALDVEMGPPIHERPEDLALARQLEELPATASILSLPMKLALGGAAVDERVLVHRRRQVGAFASVVPLAFRQAALALGDWPRSGLEIATALGASHLVVPRHWFEMERGAALAAGHRIVAETDSHAILALPDRSLEAHTADAWHLDAPSTAAPGRWVTLAISRDVWTFEPRGHELLTATWRRGDATSEATATVLYPGVVGPSAPARIHVPVPRQIGRYQLHIPFPAFAIETGIDVREQPTSFDLPIRDAHIELATGTTPKRLRAGSPIEIDVTLRADHGPLLLASSRYLLPERRGEALLLVQFRASDGSRSTERLPDGLTLTRDLAPGESRRQRWPIQIPLEPDRYDLYVKLVSKGLAERPMSWHPLLRDLEVVLE